jgi:ABC-type uncharacterized transport system substrate-binding protein
VKTVNGRQGTGKSKTRIFGFALCGILVALSAPVHPQQPKKVPRIGYLTSTSPSAQSARIETFRQGLHELGYVEGKNIVIEYRYAEGKLDRLPGLAAELVGLKIDIIVSGGPAVTRAAKEATGTIPIVMEFDNDPVGNGFVTSLAHPGGNITGLSTLAPEISGKQLELLKAIVPRLSRVAVIGSSVEAGYAQVLKEMELVAGALSVKLQNLDIVTAKDIEPVFQTATKGRADAILVLVSSIIATHITEILSLAAKTRLPTIYYRTEYVENGGLLSYGVSFADLDRRAAIYVDKILKGAKPGDLPVEQPTKFELVINLKTAKAIGVTIPQSVLYKADRVIK